MSREKNISVIKKSLRCTTRRKDEWTLAQNASPSPSASPPETCLDSQNHFGLNHSKSYHNTQQSMKDFAAASDCIEYVTIEGMGQRSVVSHHGRFSEMHFHAVCGQRTSQAILLERGQYQPCPWPCRQQGGVDGGEKGWSHTSPYCWITGDGKAAGFRGRLIACLCSSDSCKQWLKLFPQAKGTCPAEGHCILCLGAWGEVGGCPSCCCTHTHKCAHTQHTKGFWKARPGSQLVSLHCHPK